MQTIKRFARTATALLLAVLVISCSMILPGTTLKAEAASNLNSIGLAEHGLRAYREGWEYNYATYGNKNSNGVRTTDCSGLVYAYLCWDSATGTVKPNWSYPRTVTQLINNSSISGSIDNLPRTHGLLITVGSATHVGIYVGNGMVADNSSYDVDMRYASVYKHGWARWHKLNCITYPTNGWYKFDGNYYYYEDGEYVINTTRTVDGVTYSFGSDGISDKVPGNATNSGYDSGSSSKMNAHVTTGVRLRKGPGTEYGTVSVLSEGVRVNVIGTKYSGWYAVETTSGQRGYISTQYVKVTGTIKESDNLPSFDKPSSGGSTQTTSGEGAKVTTAVHLRSGKSTSSGSLGIISAGTSVTVTDKSDSSWYGVSVNGKSGYMFREYVKLNSASSSGGSSSGSSSVSIPAVTTAGVYMRSGKGTNYSTVTLLNESTSVTVTDTSNSEWYGVSVNGKTGYVYSQYLKLTGSNTSTGSSSTGSSSSSGSLRDASAWTSAGVYMRSGKGTSYDSVALLNQYTPVVVTDTSNSEWYGVSVDGKTGYIYSQYIKFASGTPSVTAEKKTATAYLNLRESASTGSSVLLVIPENASVSVIEKTDSNWYKVIYNGKTGYVSTNYLK